MFEGESRCILYRTMTLLSPLHSVPWIVSEFLHPLSHSSNRYPLYEAARGSESFSVGVSS